MVDRPILFSAPMVQALLAGRKTQTRRILKPQPEQFDVGDGILCDVGCMQVEGEACNRIWLGSERAGVLTSQRLNYAKGDRLWVKETWQMSGLSFGAEKPSRGAGRLHYRATDDGAWKDYWGNWRPSIFMPRWASRITLTVTDVRVERLQDISGADARAEGLGDVEIFGQSPGDWYRELWDSINGKDAWDANPWVAAISFTVEQRNIDA